MTRPAGALLFLLLAAPFARADAWVMPGLEAQWIARDMTLNGVPASMRSLHGRRSLADVLTYYRRLGERLCTHPCTDSVHEYRQGVWHVLAMKQRGTFASLRLRSVDGGVHGVLTTSADPATARVNLSSELPVPSGLTSLSHQSFRDRASGGENLTLLSPRSVAYERQAFVALYQNDGWTPAEDRAAKTVPDGHVLQFLRGKEQVRVVLYRDPGLASGRTLILVSAHRN